MKNWLIICLIMLAGCHDIVLDNGDIEVHLSKAGGSIFHVSPSGGQNLINNNDLGRRIQQSFYAGELQTHPDQHPAWSPWPWNIVQSGDVSGNEADMIPLFVTRTRAVLMTTPMLWDRNNQRESCATLISDITLIGNTIRVHVSLILSLKCPIINPQPHHQEMPAVYTAGNLNHLISGNQSIQNQGNLIWEYWVESEKWAGAFDSRGQGIAVYMMQAELFIGGRYENGSDQTTYFAPLRTLTLQPGDTLNYTYWIIVGTVQEVREFICECAGQ